MYKSTPIALLLLSTAVILAACSPASGLKYKAYSVAQSHNSQPAYLVKCYGLLEGAGTCQKRAQEICKDRPVYPLEDIAPLASESSGSRNTRELTFQCGAPQSPAPVATTPPPAPVVAPVSAPVAIAREMSLNGDANFDVGQSVLKPEAQQRLDQLIADARGTSFSQIRVSGYTDTMGSDSSNLHLSTRRAQTVAEYLRSHGLQARQYVTHGYGKANPVASNRTLEGRAKNRRVVIDLDR